jgi:hypothetical protein
MILTLELFLAFCTAFFFGMAIFAMGEIYFNFRWKRIKDYVQRHSGPWDLEKIRLAQKRFWVWPIEKALGGNGEFTRFSEGSRKARRKEEVSRHCTDQGSDKDPL